jgi:hypothetical protein
MENKDIQQIELLDLEIEDLLNLIIGLTSTKAIQYLGMPIKQDEKPEKDLKRARVAIDTTNLLVQMLEPYIDGNKKQQLIQMISNLQLSYVKES